MTILTGDRIVAEQKKQRKPSMTMAEAREALKALPILEEYDEMVEALKQTKPRYRRLYVDCALGKAGKRGVFKMMCLSCGEQTREEVQECRVLICPLRRYRPYQPKGVGA